MNPQTTTSALPHNNLNPINGNELQTWLEISKTAFDHNIHYYKNIIGPANKLAVVIKSNGYGHGLQNMAQLCQDNTSVDWLCVAQLSEALALDNIIKPILVLGYSDACPKYAVGKNIHFMVDSMQYATMLNAIGKRYSYQFNVHVKVDTGLCRMGVLPSEALLFVQELKALHNIKINGIYSHFAASDSNPEFTKHQLATFSDVLTTLNDHGIAIENVHMSNSAALTTINYPATFTMFRLGLGAYGLGNDSDHLQPVLTWKTRITNIKTVPADSYISYAGTYQTTRTTRIALLPIGYYDGYDIRFSNKTTVVINGHQAPVVGRVAMNVTIVDVTDLSAQIGDVVTLLGVNSSIGAQDLAGLAKIKNVREILTGINLGFVRIIKE